MKSPPLDTISQLAQRHSRWLPMLIFVASIVTLGLFLTLLPSSLAENDSHDYLNFYLPVGQSLAAGTGFLLPDGRAAVRYPPGYPILIAGVIQVSERLHLPYDTLMTLLIILLSATTTILVYFLARLVWGALSSLIVSLAWLLNPISLWYVKQPSSEIPFLVVFIASTLLFVRLISGKGNTVWLSLACGVLIGVAMLIRAAAVGLGVVMSLLVLLLQSESTRRTRIVSALLILLGNVAVIMPWQLWLSTRVDTFALLSTGGPASIVDGLTFAAGTKDYRQEVPVPPDVLELQTTFEYGFYQMTFADIAAFVAQQAIEQPIPVLKLYAIKAARSWYGTDSFRYENLILPIQIVFLAVVLAGAVRTWRRHRRLRPVLIVLGLFVLYFWLMTIMVLSIVRYMLPAIALLTICLPGIWERGTTAAPTPSVSPAG